MMNAKGRTSVRRSASRGHALRMLEHVQVQPNAGDGPYAERLQGSQKDGLDAKQSRP